ncbi:MAG: glycine cleavage system aminomethyltransferase GcvT [Limnochordales bacterium]|nr:glycine cleavage system aminomethyltransferase GcvT [Limnochordales bacterium]
MNQQQIRSTPLASRHAMLGARWTTFAGWRMPLQYTGILAEHRAVRQAAALFDLCHMGEVLITGEAALPFLAWSITNDPARLESGQAQYSCLCLPDGGIVDDIVIYRLPRSESLGSLPRWYKRVCRQTDSPEGEASFLVVVNASCREKDLSWWKRLLSNPELAGPDRKDHFSPQPNLIDASDSIALLAVQGPRAEEILRSIASLETPLSELRYFWCDWGRVAGVPALVARTGYTGEDGFELYIDVQEAEAVWDALLAAGSPKGLTPAGLGARDTLRMEMKYALYGNDIDESITPLEAGLGWAVKFQKGLFVGRTALVRQKIEGIKRQLVALVMEDHAIPRRGCPIVYRGKQVGTVTSGGFSPTLERGIALGYVPTSLVPVGTKLEVEIRGETHPARVARAPLVPSHIKR